MNVYTPQEVVDQGIADWLAERTAELDRLARHAANSRNAEELELRVAAYADELKRYCEQFSQQTSPDAPLPTHLVPLPLPRLGWLDMVLAIFRGR